MDWKDEELAEVMKCGSSAAPTGIYVPALPSSTLKAMMTKAVELVAARGGTMTAEQVRRVTDAMRTGGHGDLADALDEHISYAGARVAVMEAELAKSNKAEFARAEECMSLRERLTAAEDGNRDLVRRAQQAESERDQWQREHGSAIRRWKAEKDNAETWRKRVEAAADELADIGAGECGRLDIVTRVRMLKARCAALSAAEQALSAHVDKECPTCADAECAVHPTSQWAKTERHPCSATCTHDDAATPGHPERVRLLSGAVSKVTGLEGTITERGPAEAPVCSRCGRRFPGAQAPHGGEPCDVPLAHPERVKERSEAFKKTAREPDSSLSVTEAACYEQGAEAMRAACWVAVQAELQKMGVFDVGIRNNLKSAIEGAAP